jgi:para-nitrobenzyl esterase
MVTTRNEIVRLAAGDVQGCSEDGVSFYRAIPYAAAPVGEYRFLVPQPVLPWETPRDATAPGANAPQRTRQVPGLDAAPLIGTRI